MKLFSDDEVDSFVADGAWTTDTWGSCFHAQAESYGDQECLVDAPNKTEFLGQPSKRLTWSQLHLAVRRCAEIFFDGGIREGDVVGIQIPNSVELVITYLALVRLGAIMSPYHVANRRHEIRQFVEITGTRTIITVDEFHGRDLAEDAAAAIGSQPRARLLVWHGTARVEATVGEGVACRAIDLDDVLSGPRGNRAVEAYCEGVQATPGDGVAVLFTSGTTGVPKGVPRGHGDSLASGASTRAEAQLNQQDVILCPMPLVTGGAISGMLLPWLLTGCKLVLHHPFSLAVFAAQIEEEEVSYTIAPPAILTDMVIDESAFTNYNLSSLRRLGSGSAPLSGWMIERWETDHGVEVINFFGSTEGVQLFANRDTMPSPELRGRRFPMPGSPHFAWRSQALANGDVRLVDLGTGEEIATAGRPGELRVKGANVFSGYLNGGREGFDDEGYYCTGDIFERAFGPPDVLVLVDRSKDLIIRGGMNISAVELESLLTAHPQVADVAAVGKVDARLGERTCVFIVPRDAAHPPELADLIDFLNQERIATYKLPEMMELVDELPRSAAGKIVKSELRDRINKGGTSPAVF